MKNKKEDFVHLHTHSDNSTLDGGSKIKDYVEEAVRRGNPAISFTDHGTMRGYMHQYEECKKTEVKPVYGIEFYVCNDMNMKGLTPEEKTEITKGKKGAESKKAIKDYEDRHGISKRWHITAWAHNSEGLKNLFRLSSSAYIDGFYYKPRIDLEALCERKEGISLGTGCLASPVYDSCVLGKKKFAVEFSDRLRDEFGRNLWIEMQPHNIPDQVVANKFALELRKRYGKSNRLLATQDAHYVHQSDSEHHEVLLCIGTNSFMSDPNRFKFDGNEFHMRTRKEMKRAFFKNHPFLSVAEVKEALNSTVKLADMCDVGFTVDYHQALLPELDVPDKYRGDQTAYLKDLCLEGWHWRNIKARARKYATKNGVGYEDAIQTYGSRLKYELGSIVKLKFVPYFLIIRDLYKFARSSGIMCGPGRGSVGGCLVAYLLGITSVDPLEHGLIFERFMNPYRIDLPDIDCDFEDRRRPEIFEYLIGKYGRDRVAQIATVGKLSGKQCLKDVSRVLEVPLSEVNQVTKSIIERSSGDERASQTIEDSFKDFDVCINFNKKHPKVLYHARSLEGLAKNPGIHAAGVVASPVPLTDLLPLEVRKAESGGESVIVTATDMYNVAAVGLVKIDVLGLRTLTVIKECLEAIEENTGEKLDLEADDFDLNDPETLQGFTDHKYDGIFQYDTPSADKICMGIKFTDFEDIPAMTALNRPGTARSGLATKYIQRKKNPKLAAKVDFHPKVSAITSDTLGIIVYQEHVIRIFTDIAGFAPGTADSLRKTIAKKIGDETLGKERVKFVEGAAKHAGVDEKTANKIMDAITFFGCISWKNEVLTVNGNRKISELKNGDAIFSLDGNGQLVRNKIKNCGESGHKELVKIAMGDGRSVECSKDHWWLTSEGWKKTSILRIGDKVLSIHAETLHRTRKNKREDTAETDWVATDNISHEERQPQISARLDQSSAGKMVTGTQSDNGRCAGQKAIEKRDSTPQGWIRNEQQAGEPRIAASRRTHIKAQEGVSRTTLSDRRLRVSGVLSPYVRGALSTLVQDESNGEWNDSGQSARGRSDGALADFAKTGSIEQSICQFSEIKNITPVGAEVTYDLECEYQPANYLVWDGESWLSTHNSYGFNKTICKNAWVWKPGANSHSKSQIQIGELVRLRDSRDERGRLTPIAQKIRGGRLHLLQMDEDGRVRPARLIGIHDHGIRETFVIETESGNKTPAISRMHRLMTSRGYKSIATGLSVGDELMFMGENTAKDYCPWWMNKDTRFAQADRINDKYKLKVEQVWIESGSRCSNCGTICRQGRGGGEVAHIKSPAECDYNHAAFHSKANLRLLCNSCHKKLDYEKGERTKRWGKGRPTFADKIIKITPNGKEHCYDLEMDSVGHNFVAGHSPDSPPVVSHNSHATEYGLIGYWTMWLKIHYPLEFYWALLKNEPDRIRIQRLAKAAKKNYGIELKPPHINVSREQFSMDPGDRSIRGSLIDIKGVGAAASKAIIAEQPYKDFIDFVSRVDKKKCHKGVVMALTKAGALENMIPSVKWMVDNLESIWSLVTKKKYADVIDTMEKAKGAEEYGKEDLCLISAEVNPLALGTHPIEAYRDFIETNIKLPIVSMSDEDFFADYGNTSCFVAAVIVEVKYNQIGDFHTGALPTERERKEMFWGARYANVNLEDPGGKQYRTKFDIDVFDEYRAIIDKGLGTPVVACVTPNAKYENLKAHFAVNIESLRSKLQSGESLNIWESIVVGKHPALSYEWKNDKIREIRTTNCKFHKSKDGGFYTGIVTNVRKKYDKNGNEMAFLGVLAADGKLIEIISFASTWRSIGKHISIGKLIAIEVEKKSDRRRSTSYFCGTALKIYNYK